MSEANSKLLIALNKYISMNKSSVKRTDINTYSIKNLVEIRYFISSKCYCVYINNSLISCYKVDEITDIIDNLNTYATENAGIIYENFLQIVDKN